MSVMLKFLTGLVVAGNIAVFCGCATDGVASADQGSSATQAAQLPPYVPVVNTYTTVGKANAAGIVNITQEVLDGQFAQYLQMREFRLMRSNDGFGTAAVAVKNATAIPLRTKYRFDWLDATGATVEDTDHMGWEKTTIGGGRDFVLKSLAPSKRCVSYRLSIKYILPEGE